MVRDTPQEPTIFGQRMLLAIKEAGHSQRSFAEFAKIHQNTINRIARGLQQKVDVDMAQKIADALGIDVAYLNGLQEERRKQKYGNSDNVVQLPSGNTREGAAISGSAGPDTVVLRSGHRPPPELLGRRDLPVYAAVEGGPGEMVVAQDPVEYVARPDKLRGIPEAYAVLVRGESMAPLYRPGDQLLVNPRKPWRLREAIVVLYATKNADGEEHGDGRAMVKEVVSWTSTAVTLRQYNPPGEFTVSLAEWNDIHRVIGKYDREL